MFWPNFKEKSKAKFWWFCKVYEYFSGTFAKNNLNIQVKLKNVPHFKSNAKVEVLFNPHDQTKKQKYILRFYPSEVYT